jgi:uncharacterized membrane protein (TIGR01666 family)
MDYLKEYRSFLYSHYVTGGLRMTVGILLPAFIAGYFNQLPIGLTVSLGALAVTSTDNPGPIQHRRNALIACTIATFFVSLITGVVNQSSLLFSVWLLVGCFFFSMIGVYGARVTSLGLACILVMVLQSHERLQGWEVLWSSLYLLGGSVWYLLLSLVLYSLRPYRLVQQALGDYIMSAADYLRIKASFYHRQVDYEAGYKNLLQTQRDMQEKQNLVTELLFKTRDIVKESTHVGRVLMMLFLDTTEMFELAMTSHQDYEKLHHDFDETGILDEYEQLIRMLADEMDKVGLAVKSGHRSNYRKQVDKQVAEERTHLQELRLRIMNPQNLEGFISLKHILDSIENLAAQVRTLHHYTTYDVKLRRKKFTTVAPETFVQHQSLDPKLLIDNLSFKANIFRHSLRLSLAALFAYMLTTVLPLGKNVGHAYWVLLTVVVIIKPAYSLTRQRNVERLIGTLIGALIGALLIYLVKNETVTLVLLVVFAAGTYSFLRRQYLVSVVLMTTYLLLMFHLLEPQSFRTVLQDRVIDTVIGSGVAFLFSFLLPPVWEHETIDDYMTAVLEKNLAYYSLIAQAFTGKPIDKAARNLARRQSWVSLANLSDALNRMLNEPKWKQRNAALLHQFIVSNHMLTSHIATLAYYTENLKPEYVLPEYQPVIDASIRRLQQALEYIKQWESRVEAGTQPTYLSTTKDDKKTRALEEKINELLQQRRQEIAQKQYDTNTRQLVSNLKSITDQFYFIDKIAADVEKVSGKVKV